MAKQKPGPSETGSYRGVAIDVIAGEVTRLQKEHKQLLPEHVVDAARSAQSPLHRAFDWDEKSCVQRDLNRQAAKLIMVVRVHVGGGEKPHTKPLLYKVKIDSARHAYVPGAEIVQRADYVEGMLLDLFSAVKSANRKTNDLRLLLLEKTGVKYAAHLKNLDAMAEGLQAACEAAAKIYDKKSEAA